MVGFLLDVQEGKRELLDCRTCERPQPVSCFSCPLANGEQPEIPHWLMFYLNLHKRVKRYGALPDPGGLLDQHEPTMKILDWIETVIEEREAQTRKKDKDERARVEREIGQLRPRQGR